MADRNATIRLKVEGGPAVAGEFRQIAQQMKADQVGLNRAAKVVAAAMEGKDAEAIAQAQEREEKAQARQLATIARAERVASNNRLQVQKYDLERSHDMVMENVDLTERQRTALEWVYQAQRARLQDRIDAPGRKAAEKEAAERIKLEQKAADQLEKEEEARYVRSETARIKFIADRTKSEEKAAADKVKLEEKAAAEKEKQGLIEARKSNLAATQGAEQGRRRELDGLKANIQARYAAEDLVAKRQADLAKMGARQQVEAVKEVSRAAITENREVARVEDMLVAAQMRRQEQLATALGKQWKERTATGGRGEGPGHGFGAKMVMGYAVGRLAGEAMGGSEAQELLGSTLSAALFGGPWVAAAVAGVETVGIAIRGQHDSAVAAMKATQDYVGELRQLETSWANLATAQIDRTPVGAMAMKQIQQSTDAILKLDAAMAQMKVGPLGGSNQGGPYLGVGDRMAMLFKDNINAAPSMIQYNALAQQSGLRMYMLKKSRELEGPAYDERVKGEEEVLAAKKKTYAFDLMPKGFLKEQKQLEEDINLRHTERERVFREELSASKAGVAMAREHLDLLNRMSAEEKKRPENIRAIQLAAMAQEDAQRDLDRLSSEHARKRAADAAAEKHERDVLGAQNRYMLQEATAAYSGQAAAAVDARRQDELRDRGATDEQTRQVQVGKYLLETEQSGIAAAMARRDITLKEAEIQRGMAADKRSNYIPAVEDAIKAAALARDDAANAAEMDRHRISAEQSVLDKRYAQHQITTEEYEMQRAMAADRRAQENPEVAAALRKAMAAKEEAAVVQDVMQYRKQQMAVDLDYRVKRHGISERDADIERMILNDRRAQERGPAGDAIRKEIVALADARQKLRETDVMNTGSFGTQYARGMVDFRALNQDRPYWMFRGGAIDQGFKTGRGQTGNQGRFGPALRFNEGDKATWGRIEKILTNIERNLVFN